MKTAGHQSADCATEAPSLVEKGKPRFRATFHMQYVYKKISNFSHEPILSLGNFVNTKVGNQKN